MDTSVLFRILDAACRNFESADESMEDAAISALALIPKQEKLDGDTMVSYMVLCAEKKHCKLMSAIKNHIMNRGIPTPSSSTSVFKDLRTACVNSNYTEFYKHATEMASASGCDMSAIAIEDLADSCRKGRRLIANVIVRANHISDELLGEMALTATESGSWDIAAFLLETIRNRTEKRA